MTRDDLLSTLEKRYPSGWSTGDLMDYCLQVINSQEGIVHVAQSQVAAAQQNAKTFERKAGGEMIARQRIQIELDDLKKELEAKNA